MTYLAANQESGDQRLVRGARSKVKIIDAALSILGEGGYGALSISAICKRAGVSPTSLYHHFGDKAGLMSAMIDEAFARSEQLYLASLEGLDSPFDQLEAFMESVRYIFADETRNSGAILSALSQARGDSDEMAKMIGAARRRIWKLVAARFAEYFRIENGMILTHIFTAFSSYIPQVQQDPDSEADIESLLDTLRTVLLMIGAVIQPDLLKDEKYAAAVSRARQELLDNKEAISFPCEIITFTENT